MSHPIVEEKVILMCNNNVGEVHLKVQCHAREGQLKVKQKLQFLSELTGLLSDLFKYSIRHYSAAADPDPVGSDPVLT